MTTTPAIGWVTSRYGKRKAPLKADGTYGSTFHVGVDIGGPSGTPIVAPQPGEAFVNSTTLRGLYVVVDHGRYRTLHQHLASAAVVTGEHVTEGQQVGVMGTSGGVARHLHTEVHDATTPIDPTPWYLERGVTLGIAQAVAGVSTTPPTPPPALEDDMAVTRSHVEGIYWTQLGRGPSDREVDERITESLEGAGHTAADLLRSVRNSDEYRAYRIRRAYQDLLGRASVDAGGLATWLSYWEAAPGRTEGDVWNKIREDPAYAAFMARPKAERDAAIAAARATLTRR
jgi:hypothetical protein